MSRYKGWVELQPSSNDKDQLVPFQLPLNVDATFTISCNTASNLLLPLPNSDEANTPSPEATLIVTESRVYLEHCGNSKGEIRINEQVLGVGDRSALLKHGDIISFGEYSYRYNVDLTPAQLPSAALELLRCCLCQQSQNNEEVRVLPCGHNICGECREKSGQQMVHSPLPNRPNLRPSVRSGILGRQPVVHCHSCRRNVLPGSVGRSFPSVTTVAISENLRELVELDANRPECADCSNRRCFVDAREYRFCEDCQRVLCPVCVVHWHRDHRFRQQFAVHRSINYASHALQQLRKTFETLEPLDKEFLAPKSAQDQKPETECVRKFRKSLAICREKYRELIGRKRELSFGWDDVSQRLSSEFQQQIDKIRRIVEHLRTNDHSLTCSPSADTEEAVSPNSAVVKCTITSLNVD